jgi:hypothetical protein
MDRVVTEGAPKRRQKKCPECGSKCERDREGKSYCEDCDWSEYDALDKDEFPRAPKTSRAGEQRGAIVYSVARERPNMFGGKDITHDAVHRGRQYIEGTHHVSGGSASSKEILPVLATVDELAELERRGDVTAEIRQSGEKFRELYHSAKLNSPQITIDYTRERVDGGLLPGNDTLPAAVESALTDVRAAMRALGDNKDPVRNVIEDVVGRGESLQSWVRRRKLNAVAGGANLVDGRRYLIQGLERLDTHFRPAVEPEPDRVAGGAGGGLKDLARLIPAIAATNDPAAAWLAQGLAYWRQHPDVDLETALGFQQDERRRDVLHRRDRALRRLAARLNCTSPKKLILLFQEYERRREQHALAAGVDTDLREAVECGARLLGESQLYKILGR